MVVVVALAWLLGSSCNLQGEEKTTSQHQQAVRHQQLAIQVQKYNTTGVQIGHVLGGGL